MPTKRTIFIYPILISFFAYAFSIQSAPPLGTTALVSQNDSGVIGNDGSGEATISADGRYVAFASRATNLVAGDTNNKIDVFVRDRVNNTIERVSIPSGGGQGNDDSFDASISANGRFIAFTSFASNLVTNDTNGIRDVFYHDRVTGITGRASISSTGTEGDDYSFAASISGDGRYIAFESIATTLIPNDTNMYSDIFVHDRVSNQTERVSVSSSGGEADSDSWAASISANGLFVVFASDASDLVAGDTTYWNDVFLHDRVNGTTERISLAPSGAEADNPSDNPVVSADGSHVAYFSWATNLVTGDTNGEGDIFVYNKISNTTKRVSISSAGLEADDKSIDPAISANGQYITFTSLATNLVMSDSNSVEDIFVHDSVQNSTERVSIASSGAEGNGDSQFSAISGNGLYIVFHSTASNLVVGDTNNTVDIFVHEPHRNKVFLPVILK